MKYIVLLISIFIAIFIVFFNIIVSPIIAHALGGAPVEGVTLVGGGVFFIILLITLKNITKDTFIQNSILLPYVLAILLSALLESIFSESSWFQTNFPIYNGI